MDPIYFKNQDDFRKWLEVNHELEQEVYAGFYRTSTGKPCMTWSESVDQALCFGWIDGIRRKIDEERYCIRFTPRRPGSVWSKINIKKIEDLTAKGLMFPAGLRAFSQLKPEKSGIYSFENEPVRLNEALEAKFKSNSKAWDFFSKQAPSYRKGVITWIMSAKQDTTKIARLRKLIDESEKQNRLRG